MDLINIPLPADLLQYERSSNAEANHFEKKGMVVYGKGFLGCFLDV